MCIVHKLNKNSVLTETRRRRIQEETALRTATTFIVSQTTCFLMWVKLVVGHQLRSHPCPIFMWRQFPMSNRCLSTATMITKNI